MTAQAVGLAPPSTTCTRLGHGRASPRTSTRSPASARRRWPSMPGVRVLGPTDDRGPRGSGVVRRRRRPRARRRPGARRPPASRCGSATTAPGRCTAGSACRRPRGPRSTSYNDAGRGRRAASPACARSQDVLRAGLTSRCSWTRCTRRSSSTTTSTPHARGLREPFDAEVHQVNPTCGDEVTLRVRPSARRHGRADVSYDGLGCSISQASTSVLTDLVIGGRVAEALAARRRVP